MPHIKWTEEKIAKRIKDWYGAGIGAQYRPWLGVLDISSLGRSRRVWGLKTQRTHELFSDVEHDIFIATEWATNVLDIREQFPLDRDITQSIALDLKIKHPFYPGTHVPTVMTVDFLVTMTGPDGEHLVAFNAKRDEEAEDPRSLEKLEIQRTYFETQGIPHHLIYHSAIPKAKVKNIYWIRRAQLSEDEVEPNYPGFFSELKTRLASALRSYLNDQQSTSLATVCAAFDVRHGLEPGTALRVARMLMQDRTLIPDLESKDIPADRLANFRMASTAHPASA